MKEIDRYICIHGHFYQPPRENAWLEAIELQESAAPFHDWNERINFECYATNTAARVLDDEHQIINLVNNYSRISFNFGPTLLSWMEKNDPGTYASILEADAQSQKQFDGHGSAIAQAYSHLIMPLANRRDKETQVIWGITDFEYRFGRKPEGMWLPETAVDLETLEVLAEQGIQYTILAPRQAKAIRPPGEESWQPVDEGSLDIRRPYWCRLPSGKRIALFFYEGGVSRAVAFEGLLNNGKTFAHRLMEHFGQEEEIQLMHIATDGETYGHHHRSGEMALADCLQYIEGRQDLRLTVYGAFLAEHPPLYEVEIHENSSWSCVHGVERWRSNCGCNSGRAGWHQEWRAPLREALDWLRDELEEIFEQQAGKLVADPWEARNRYISVVLNRGKNNLNAWLKEMAKHPLDDRQRTSLLRLLEMQRQAMQMYTSCGWFFDEISGIETNQILQYALRAINFAKQVAGKDLLPAFVKKLEQAPSNVHANGGESFKKNVMPGWVDLERVGMHFAAASLFEEFPEKLTIFNYQAKSSYFERFRQGNYRLALGRTIIRSRITRSEKEFSFAVLYLGQQQLIGHISTDMEEDAFSEVAPLLEKEFGDTNLGAVFQLMQAYFGKEVFSFRNLFRDERRKILRRISEKSLRQAMADFREIYNDNYQLMTAMQQTDLPVPEAFLNVVRFVINNDLDHFFARRKLDIRELQHICRELQKWDVEISDESSLKLQASERIFREIKKIAQEDVPLEHLEMLITHIQTLKEMKVKLDYWKSQNAYFNIIRGYKKNKWVFASKDWEDAFKKLGRLLEVKVEIDAPVSV